MYFVYISRKRLNFLRHIRNFKCQEPLSHPPPSAQALSHWTVRINTATSSMGYHMWCGSCNLTASAKALSTALYCSMSLMSCNSFDATLDSSAAIHQYVVLKIAKKRFILSSSCNVSSSCTSTVEPMWHLAKDYHCVSSTMFVVLSWLPPAYSERIEHTILQLWL